jgi:hypothetical protein
MDDDCWSVLLFSFAMVTCNVEFNVEFVAFLITLDSYFICAVVTVVVAAVKASAILLNNG